MAKADAEPVNIHDAKRHFSRLVAEVEADHEVTINRDGRPVARLVPYRSTFQPRTPGALRGRIEIHDDFDTFTAVDDSDWYRE